MLVERRAVRNAVSHCLALSAEITCGKGVAAAAALAHTITARVSSQYGS
jgi:hypothetical protein